MILLVFLSGIMIMQLYWRTSLLSKRCMQRWRDMFAIFKNTYDLHYSQVLHLQICLLAKVYLQAPNQSFPSFSEMQSGNKSASLTHAFPLRLNQTVLPSGFSSYTESREQESFLWSIHCQAFCMFCGCWWWWLCCLKPPSSIVLKCCVVFRGQGGRDVPCGTYVCARKASFSTTYSAAGREFTDSKTKAHIK